MSNTPPTVGQEPWGDDLNAYLASLEAGVGKTYDFSFWDGTADGWTVGDPGQRVEDVVWGGTIGVVNTGLVGRSGYALRIAETAPGQWWESEPIWGILYTPTFPCKPGDICTTRFIVAVERPDASWDGRLTVYSSGIGGIFEGNSTLDHDNWQDTAPRITFINETATKLWIANYVGYGGPSSISNEVVIETAGVASGRGEMDIYPETSMLTGVTPLPVIFRILSATVTVKSPPSTGLTPVSTASAPTEHRRPVPPPWHSRSEVEP